MRVALQMFNIQVQENHELKIYCIHNRFTVFQKLDIHVCIIKYTLILCTTIILINISLRAYVNIATNTFYLLYNISKIIKKVFKLLIPLMFRK